MLVTVGTDSHDRSITKKHRIIWCAGMLYPIIGYLMYYMVSWDTHSRYRSCDVLYGLLGYTLPLSVI